jgi:hypothetical protein
MVAQDPGVVWGGLVVWNPWDNESCSDLWQTVDV